MGYYTEHTMTVRNVLNKDQYEALKEEMESRDLIGYAFDEGSYDEKNHEVFFGCYDSAKWYDHPTDMVAIAEKFPNMFFELCGAGEEFGDFWKEYYHDMDVETCRGDVVFEKPHKIPWDRLIKF